MKIPHTRLLISKTVYLKYLFWTRDINHKLELIDLNNQHHHALRNVCIILLIMYKGQVAAPNINRH